MIITEPGIYQRVSNQDYHNSHGISSSGLGCLLPPNCPALYQYRYLSGLYVKEDNKSFSLGSAVHTLVLEPELFASGYAVLTEKPPIRRGEKGLQAYAEFMAKYEGKTILTPEEYDLAHYMADALSNHSVFKSIYGMGNGHIENSIAWIDDDSGAFLRSRPDYYNDSLVLDIKTTKDVRSHSFIRSVVDYGYHRQGAMACDGLTEVTGRSYETVVNLAVSREAPHLVKAYAFSSESLSQGRAQYKEGAKIYRACLDFNYWPGYDEFIENIELPGWACTEL